MLTILNSKTMKTLQKLKDTLFHLKAQRTHNQVRIIMRSYEIDFNVYLPTLKKDLQRPFVWNNKQKTELIMSLLLERTIPNLSFYVFYDFELRKEVIQVIDGKQRLSTIIAFVKNEFSIVLEGSNYLFKDLPNDYQVQILQHPVPSYTIYDTPKKLTDKEKIDWFKSINFSGTPQEEQFLESLV